MTYEDPNENSEAKQSILQKLLNLGKKIQASEGKKIINKETKQLDQEKNKASNKRPSRHSNNNSNNSKNAKESNDVILNDDLIMTSSQIRFNQNGHTNNSAPRNSPKRKASDNITTKRNVKAKKTHEENKKFLQELAYIDPEDMDTSPAQTPQKAYRKPKSDNRSNTKNENKGENRFKNRNDKKIDNRTENRANQPRKQNKKRNNDNIKMSQISNEYASFLNPDLYRQKSVGIISQSFVQNTARKSYQSNRQQEKADYLSMTTLNESPTLLMRNAELKKRRALMDKQNGSTAQGKENGAGRRPPQRRNSYNSRSNPKDE